jgi:hypothetical protein
MSVDEYRLGDKVHSEHFAHTVADLARKRQEVAGSTPVADRQSQGVPA